MRVNLTNNPWNTHPHHSGLVDIDTHALWASVSGPIRKPNDPLLIFITGAGGPSAIYVKLQQHLSTFVRVLFYDRAGYDRSTLPSLKDGERIYAADTARDLTALVSATHLEPPYIIAAHSFGGIIARQFLALHGSNPSSVAGMLLFDTATELMLQIFPRIPPLELNAVARNVDVPALTHLQRDSGMSDAEWTYALAAQERCGVALSKEDTHASAHALALLRQLDTQAMGDVPLNVVQCNMTGDYQMWYDEGVRLGDGTEEERKASRTFIGVCRLYHGQIARAQCGLSADMEFRYFGDWGHDLPIRKAEVVGGEVRGLLARARRREASDR